MQRRTHRLPVLEGRTSKAIKQLEAKILEATEKVARKSGQHKGLRESVVPIVRPPQGSVEGISLVEALRAEGIDECMTNWEPWLPLHL